MTSHVARLYALSTALLLFFASWLTIATHPWASAKAAAPDPRVALLQQREKRLRLETRRVNVIVRRRFAAHRTAVRARTRANAAMVKEHARQLAAARAAAAARPIVVRSSSSGGGSYSAPPAVRVVTLPPVASTRTS